MRMTRQNNNQPQNDFYFVEEQRDVLHNIINSMYEKSVFGSMKLLK